ncbi:MAG: bile acid:sodium symporter family protein [Nitriliruptorales bacterium]|nr:bile acid:sodium symporter family protein [Nitriliruptorales bacterium]
MDDAGVWIVNSFLALIVFGVAIDLDLDELRTVLREPRGPAIGMLGQFLLLPAATLGLTILLQPQPSVALGMLVVACAPGGAASNFIAHYGNGNASLSIGMTGLSTLAAIALTPLNISLWTRLNPDTNQLMESGVRVDALELVLTIVVLLAVPVGLGVFTQVRWPSVARRLVRPARILSILIIVVFIGGATAANIGSAPAFLSAVRTIAIGVVAHNAVGLVLGYGLARGTRLSVRDARAVSIEVGMQNAALALGLVLSFFPDLGGAAVVCATYGVWHTISGLGLAGWWRWRDGRRGAPAAAPDRA